VGHLSAAHAAYVTGREFFPHLITAPFKSGLGVAFAFAIVASLIAVVASALTGRRQQAAGAAAVAPPEPLGAELAAVAGDAGLEPSEIVGPASSTAETNGSADSRGNGNGNGSADSRGNGQSPAVTKSAGTEPR
jgi:hypothetical protein